MRNWRDDARQGDSKRPVADEAEGYLLAHVHHEQARGEAEDLCALMPWLTSGQAEDLTRHYVRKRIAFSRQVLLGTVERANELRQEYETRYADLRRALLKLHAAAACAVLACAAGAGTVASLLTR